jgi:hypothetical protein
MRDEQRRQALSAHRLGLVGCGTAAILPSPLAPIDRRRAAEAAPS